jgi:hypothetical protein
VLDRNIFEDVWDVVSDSGRGPSFSCAFRGAPSSAKKPSEPILCSAERGDPTKAQRASEGATSDLWLPPDRQRTEQLEKSTRLVAPGRVHKKVSILN